MTEMWKQCASWLCRLEVLPSNHRITWPDATIQDLAYALRDGVLLCHVAVTIDVAAIDMKLVNQRPQMAQFLCLKNIRLFLSSCLTHFGMKETDLFNPSMLYDYTDFARVLNTLSKLSNCSKAAEKEIEGFPQHEKAPSQAEEQIYRTLEDMVNEDNYEEFYYRHHGASGAYGAYGGRRSSHSREYYRATDAEEDIYEDLCSFKSSTSRRMQQELNFQPKEKRDYCIKELVETEGNYVDVLNMLRKHFIKQISVMKDADKKTIFMNIKELGETHAGFFQDILESVSGKSRKRIGDIFLDFKERFLKYGEYCAMLPRAQETLDQVVSRDEAVRAEIAKCELSANDGKFRLRDLLAVPMQRVLKYHLLLRELTDNTVSTHEEFRSVSQAYEAMLDVSDYINEVKRDSEQLYIIREIQNSITDWNMPPDVELKDYGRLRKDSELKVQSHDVSSADRGKVKIRYVFVFDKVLLMCKAARGDHYSYKDSIKLSEFRVQEAPASQAPAQSTGMRTLNRISGGRAIDMRWGHAFLLVHVDNTVAYTLTARTEEDKKKWMGAIKEALANVLPPQRSASSHDAFMFTFATPRSCDFCHKLLKGLFYQGYRCDKCGRAMHKECIARLSKCGRSDPPTLPPRPPSMLPTSSSLTNRFSNCSLDEMSSLQRQSSLASVTSLPAASSIQSMQPPPPPNLPNGSSGAANPDYINTKMEDHSWHVGEMDRDTANTRLSVYPMGTFLVRGRMQDGKCVGHALSLKTQDDVKHMKICTGPGEKEGSSVFYLSDTRKFRSVVELVAWFSRNSLKESFSGLDTLLRFSVGELSIVEAQFDFSPKTTDRNMLALRAGERVTVIDRAGEAQGWWKAYNGFKVGFIPKDFVAQIDSESKEDEEHATNGDENQSAAAVSSQDSVEEPNKEENKVEEGAVVASETVVPEDQAVEEAKG